MRITSLRVAAALGLGSLGLILSSCSGPANAKVGTPAFYWSAAQETFSAGDYMKTTDHLDHLIEGENEYTARALPWSLVLTSGMAAGYMDLADAYTSGARLNKASAALFRRKAAEYRNMASPLALRFAQNVDRVPALPAGAVHLTFSLPKGTAAVSPVVAKIAGGFQVTSSDEETAQIQALERGVLLATCEAAGAPNDTARTSEVLGHALALTPRATFTKAMVHLLDAESALYGRDKLDDPAKIAIFRQRSDNLMRALNSAMVVQAQQASQ